MATDIPTPKSLSDFKVGQNVRYVPYHADGNIHHKDCQNGVVTSINHMYVFVRFKGPNGEACLPDQLA